MVLLMMEVVNYDISRRSRVIVRYSSELDTRLSIAGLEIGFFNKTSGYSNENTCRFLKNRFFQKVEQFSINLMKY